MDYSEPYLDFGPRRERFSNADGSVYEQITYPDGRIELKHIRPPYSSGETLERALDEAIRSMDGRLVPPSVSMGPSLGWYRDVPTYEEVKRCFEKEEECKVNIVRKQSHRAGEHIVVCNDEKDLSIDNILKTLSAIKGKLVIAMAPINIQKIECAMTPLVRQTIVEASKKLKRYGKKRPIIARFDEFGNRLPDEIDIGSSKGITLKIIDPKDYGKYYIELRGTAYPKMEYNAEPSAYSSFDDLFFKKL